MSIQIEIPLNDDPAHENKQLKRQFCLYWLSHYDDVLAQLRNFMTWIFQYNFHW
jgi:hypothetical protein